MEKAIESYDVQNGAFGLVMNAKTGEILAMATLGGYDPNAYLEIYDTIIMYDYVQKHPHKYVITELIRSMK